MPSAFGTVSLRWLACQCLCSRREEIMKRSAMLVAVGVLGAGSAFAQEPIRIGAMYPLTGGGAVYGVPAMVGHQLAV